MDLGGAGALLVENTNRNLYTYTWGSDKRLTAEINAFSISNRDNIALSDLGVENDDERQAVINNIHGAGKSWVMADVIHSEPAVVLYDTNGDERLDGDDDALVYVGTNGAVMHAFRDSNGEELWGFIPPQQLGRLKRLGDDSNVHDYFIDGPPNPISYTIDGVPVKALIFGERRGGSNYYALDISAYDNPIFKYTVSADVLGENAERLGQSWGRPQFVSIATGADTTAEVLLLPGGYDTHQDAEAPTAGDTRGRAVFSVAADNGMLSTFKFYNDGESSDMTHSIVDVVGVDLDAPVDGRSWYGRPDLGVWLPYDDGDLMLRLQASMAAPAEEPGDPWPGSARLARLHPNPVGSDAVIRYTVGPGRHGMPRHVSLRVYDALGRLVAVPADHHASAGTYTLRWTPESGTGGRLPAGVYVVRLRADGPASADATRVVIVR